MATTIMNIMDEGERCWLERVPQDRAARYLQAVEKGVKREGMTLTSEAGRRAAHLYIQLAHEEEFNTTDTESRNTTRW